MKNTPRHRLEDAPRALRMLETVLEEFAAELCQMGGGDQEALGHLANARQELHRAAELVDARVRQVTAGNNPGGDAPAG